MKKRVFLVMAAWMAAGLVYGQDGLVETGEVGASVESLTIECYDLNQSMRTVNGMVQEHVTVTVTPDTDGYVHLEDIKNGIVTYLNALSTNSIDSSSIVLSNGEQPLSPVFFGKVSKAIVANGVNFSIASSGLSST